MEEKMGKVRTRKINIHLYRPQHYTLIFSDGHWSESWELKIYKCNRIMVFIMISISTTPFASQFQEVFFFFFSSPLTWPLRFFIIHNALSISGEPSSTSRQEEIDATLEWRNEYFHLTLMHLCGIICKLQWWRWRPFDVQMMILGHCKCAHHCFFLLIAFPVESRRYTREGMNVNVK